MIYKAIEGSLEKSLERLRVGKCEGSGPNTCKSYIFLGFRERSMSYIVSHDMYLVFYQGNEGDFCN